MLSKAEARSNRMLEKELNCSWEVMERGVAVLDKCVFVVSNILDSGMSAKPRTKDCQVWI